VIDFVSFGAQTTDMSMGRYPDGGSLISFLPNATPRTANSVPNSPPQLLPIADQVLVLGQTLLFTAVASDSDQPPQTLTFGLAPGAPAGAAMDPFNGHFSWTPSIAPATNQISITVSDNGQPSMSSTQSFTARIFMPPALQDIRVVAGQFAFSFFGLAGQNYQLEYKEALSDPLWLALGQPVAGNNSLLTISQDIVPNANRFFRIKLVP